jgi:hypothetical protein
MKNRLLEGILITTISASLNSCIPQINPIPEPSPQSRYAIPEENAFNFEVEGEKYFAFDLDGDCSIDVILEKYDGMTATLTNGRAFPNSKAHRVARGYRFEGKDIKLLTGFELKTINYAYQTSR